MSKKKKLIIAVAALVVMCGLLAFLLLQNRYKMLSGDGDPVECACRTTGKTLKVRIRGTFPEWYEWAALTDDNCSAKLISQKKDMICYELSKSGEEGLFTVRFILRRPGLLSDIRNTIEVELHFGLDGSLSCRQVSQSEGRSPAVYGEGSAYPFKAAFEGFGKIMLEMPRGGAGGWTFLPAEPFACRIEEQAADSAEYQYFRLSPLRYGREETLFFVHEEDDTILPLTLKIGSTGDVELAAGNFTKRLSEEETEKKLQETKYDPKRLRIFVPGDVLRLLVSCGGEEAVAAYLTQQEIPEEQVLPRLQPEQEAVTPEKVRELIDLIMLYAGTDELTLTAEEKNDIEAFLRDAAQKEEISALRESIEQAITKLSEVKEPEAQPEVQEEKAAG